MTQHYKIDGIPSDTLTSDEIGERAYKVAIDNLGALTESFALSLSMINDQNEEIIKLLKALLIGVESISGLEELADQVED